MTQKKLFSILTLVQKVYLNNWSTVYEIVKNISSIEIIDKKWGDRHKQENLNYYPLDLSDIKTWSTYDRKCIDISFYNENNNLIGDVKIYDGNFFDGHREQLRFTAKLKFPKSFIKKIESVILYNFDYFAEKCYDDHLEMKKRKWIEEFKNSI